MYRSSLLMISSENRRKKHVEVMVIRTSINYPFCFYASIGFCFTYSFLLNGPFQEEFYVKQPSDFVDHFFLNHVYKLNKTLYGLKQTPRVWYDNLFQFFINHDFTTDTIGKTLFTFLKNQHTLLVQIYVDDIIFSSTNPNLCDKIVKIMQDRFEMSIIG